MHPGANKPNTEASNLGKKKRVKREAMTVSKDEMIEESKLPPLNKRKKSGTIS